MSSETDRYTDSGEARRTHCGKIRRIRSKAVILILFWTFAVFSADYAVFSHIAIDFRIPNHVESIPAICILAFFG